VFLVVLFDLALLKHFHRLIADFCHCAFFQRFPKLRAGSMTWLILPLGDNFTQIDLKLFLARLEHCLITALSNKISHPLHALVEQFILFILQRMVVLFLQRFCNSLYKSLLVIGQCFDFENVFPAPDLLEKEVCDCS
jgi:hypothetical protein